ncbi:MAG: hypothetical protein GY757_44560, partial [bacterium]|nr:hypothetical protein [bacterium]
TGLTGKLEAYLRKAKLERNNRCFYQYVSSLRKGAADGELGALFKQREALTQMAQVFLYRAINNQQGKAGHAKTKQMYKEFLKDVQVEADFAYFEKGKFEYQRDWPFYTSRFVTVLMLQAILEVEGGSDLAPRMMNWLLEAPSYVWRTTHLNFWMLRAMNQYAEVIERETAGKAVVTIADKKMEKTFGSKGDIWAVEERLEKGAKPFKVGIKAEGSVYLTTELEYRVGGELPEARGIVVKRHVYNKKGKQVSIFNRGETYQVEILVECDKELPYGVIDEPVAAGFEVVREDFVTTGELEEFNKTNRKKYDTPWVKKVHEAHRVLYYSYRFSGKLRLVYFVKAMYSGTFTWMPTKVQGMYHPQYFGRNALRKIEIKIKPQ